MKAQDDSLAAANRRGIVLLATAMSCFVVNDAFMKHLSAALPMAQVVFLRSVLVALLVFAAAHASGAARRLPDLKNPVVMLRAVIDAGATMFYMAALVHLPIANATAINLAAPLIMTLLAVLFLGERVGPARWLAIVAGFCGVLLVIQPRAQGFNAWALLTLAATFMHAVRDLLTRRVGAAVPSLLITLAASLAACVISGAWTLSRQWQPVDALQAAQVLCSAAFVATGFYLMIASMRRGEMSVIAPFRYAGLLVALLLGFFIWGDVPNALAWGGIVLIIVSGLYILVGERWRARAAGTGGNIAPPPARTPAGQENTP